MGFFSNLKNKVTGGSATVHIHTAPAQRGQSAAIKVEATAKANAKVDGVYVLIRAYETAEVKDTDYENGQKQTETVRGHKVTYETRIALAGAQQLQEGQSYSWEGQLPIPASANPSFKGQMIGHTWEVQAGLDMTGNDPDSGWQPLQVS